MVTIKALTFREKQILLRQVFQQYNRAKIKLQCLEQRSYYPQIDYSHVKENHSRYNKSMMDKLNDTIDNKEELSNIIFTFNCILDTLTTESKRIIDKDFIEHAYPTWWYDYYSKSTYYRAKTKAMEEMLFYLNI